MCLTVKHLKTNYVTLLSLFLLLSSFSLIDVVKATAETVPVPAGQTVFRSVDLNVEDEVSGRISVIGGESDDIDFTVLGPSNQTVLSTQRVSVTNFKFSASEKGIYLFIFDNSFSSDDKTVSFNYDVRHYWFGMPQEMVLMFIIVFVGVLALVVYAMAKR
jgi:hypothetical protein